MNSWSVCNSEWLLFCITTMYFVQMCLPTFCCVLIVKFQSLASWPSYKKEDCVCRKKKCMKVAANRDINSLMSGVHHCGFLTHQVTDVFICVATDCNLESTQASTRTSTSASTSTSTSACSHSLHVMPPCGSLHANERGMTEVRHVWYLFAKPPYQVVLE